MASVNGNAAITTEELKSVLSSLKTQKETISNTYNNMIVKVLDNSASCFSVSGLDYSKISEAYKETFTKLDQNFEKLIDLLENHVIKKYSELAAALRQMFDVEFASKMEELLGIK